MKFTSSISLRTAVITVVAISVSLSCAMAESKVAPSWVPIQIGTIGTDKNEIGGIVDEHWWHGTLMGGLTSGNLVTPTTGETDATFGAFDCKGKLKWLRQYDEGRDERLQGVRASFWHGIRVSKRIATNGQFAGSSLCRLDGKGREVWAYAIPKEEVLAPGISLDGRGRSYVATTRGSGPSFNEVTLWTIDSRGMLIKKVPVEIPGGRFSAYALTHAPDGSILIEGQYYPTGGQTRTAVVRLGTNSKVVWTWMTPAGEWLPRFGLHADTDGRILVVGNRHGGNENPLLYAVSKEGQLVKRVEVAVHSTDVYRVCTGNDGQFYLGGAQYGAYLMLFTFDRDLNELSREVLDPTGYVMVNRIWMDRKGRLAVSGSYSRTLFGHPSKGQSDQFYVRLENKNP